MVAWMSRNSSGWQIKLGWITLSNVIHGRNARGQNYLRVSISQFCFLHQWAVQAAPFLVISWISMVTSWIREEFVWCSSFILNKQDGHEQDKSCTRQRHTVATHAAQRSFSKVVQVDRILGDRLMWKQFRTSSGEPTKKVHFGKYDVLGSKVLTQDFWEPRFWIKIQLGRPELLCWSTDIQDYAIVPFPAWAVQLSLT